MSVSYWRECVSFSHHHVGADIRSVPVGLCVRLYLQTCVRKTKISASHWICAAALLATLAVSRWAEEDGKERAEIKMSPWKLLEGEQGLIPSERWSLEGEGEAWAGSGWRLRRRIRCNVGDERSSGRWNIYSREAFDKPSQSDVEVVCVLFSFANYRAAAASWSCREIRKRIN